MLSKRYNLGYLESSLHYLVHLKENRQVPGLLQTTYGLHLRPSTAN
jgi:hypothetical protein